MITDDIGAQLVIAARAVVEEALGSPQARKPVLPPELSELRRGVFVSIYTHPTKELRGCMGLPLPRSNLANDLERAARMAAFQDPRFEPLRLDELDRVVFELSILSEPQPISVQRKADLPKHIVIGVDGLIIEAREGAALLLPQVPVEYGWDAEEYLMHLCLKAGLSLTDWLREDVSLYKFSAEIFAEEEPRGRVVRVVMPACR
jgi:uncharacterized protein (TIGR00296 family)